MYWKLSIMKGVGNNFYTIGTYKTSTCCNSQHWLLTMQAVNVTLHFASLSTNWINPIYFRSPSVTNLISSIINYMDFHQFLHYLLGALYNCIYSLLSLYPVQKTYTRINKKRKNKEYSPVTCNWSLYTTRKLRNHFPRPPLFP